MKLGTYFVNLHCFPSSLTFPSGRRIWMAGDSASAIGARETTPTGHEGVAGPVSQSASQPVSDCVCAFYRCISIGTRAIQFEGIYRRMLLFWILIGTPFHSRRSEEAAGAETETTEVNHRNLCQLFCRKEVK